MKKLQRVFLLTIVDVAGRELVLEAFEEHALAEAELQRLWAGEAGEALRSLGAAYHVKAVPYRKGFTSARG